MMGGKGNLTEDGKHSFPSSYFPTQNLRNTSSTTASVVRSPVRDKMAATASSMHTDTASGVMPIAMAFCASLTAASAFSAHTRCRSVCKSAVSG